MLIQYPIRDQKTSNSLKNRELWFEAPCIDHDKKWHKSEDLERSRR